MSTKAAIPGSSLVICAILLAACGDAAHDDGRGHRSQLTGTFNGYWECVEGPSGSLSCEPPGSKPPQWFYDRAKQARQDACQSDQACIDNYKINIYPRWNDFDSFGVPGVGPKAAVEKWYEQATKFQDLAATVPAADQAWILAALLTQQQGLQARVDALAASLDAKKEAVLDGGFRQRLVAEAESVRGPIVTELAVARTNAAQVDTILADYQSALAPLTARVTALAAKYAEYRALEVYDLDSIAGIATSAGAVTSYGQIANLKVALAEISSDSSSRAAPILLEALRLSAELVEVQMQFSARLAPYQDFFTDKNIEMPHLTDKAAVAASRMSEYVRRSQRHINNEIVDLITQLHRRTQLLVLSAVTAQTRAVIAQTEGARASARFLDTTTAMVAAAWKEPVKSSVLKLPLLVPQYTAMTRLMETEPICTGVRPDYAYEGCQVLASNYSKIRLHFSDSLPARLQKDANKLKAKGIDPALISALQQAIQLKDLALAVELHDQAVTKSEPQP